MTDIRLRACLAVIKEGKILLVPHYYPDHRPVEWFLPGGQIHFGEHFQAAAVREFLEETGLEAACDEMLGVAEEIEPDVPWHGVTIAFRGHIVGGTLNAENSDYSQFGDKTPRWFSESELCGLRCNPQEMVEKAFKPSPQKG